jgi:hypothetical protein
MSINMPSKVLMLKGQRVKQVQFEEGNKKLIIRCERDKRRAAIDPVTRQKGLINRLVKRQVGRRLVQSPRTAITRRQVDANFSVH